MPAHVSRDKDGFLKEPGDWTPEVAITIASEQAIDLSEDHWEIINLVRNFYRTYEVSPVMRVLVKTVRKELGDEKGTSLYLMSLFPGSPAKLAAKIAGLPKPTNCL